MLLLTLSMTFLAGTYHREILPYSLQEAGVLWYAKKQQLLEHIGKFAWLNVILKQIGKQ